MDANREQDLIRKARMFTHMLMSALPDASQGERMVAESYALGIYENMHPQDAMAFLQENYDAIYRTKGTKDDLARLMGYRDADDPRRKADTANFWQDLEDGHS